MSEDWFPRITQSVPVSFCERSEAPRRPRGEVVETLVGPPRVKPMGPVQSLDLDLIDAPPRALPADQLGLERPDRGPRESVIVHGPHRRINAGLDKPRCDGRERVLTRFNRSSHYRLFGVTVVASRTPRPGSSSRVPCVVGWRAATSMTTDLPLDALEMALWNRRHICSVFKRHRQCYGF